MIDEEKNQEDKATKVEIGNDEPIIKQEKPIFSIEDAKNITIEPERRMGKIESFQKELAKIVNPLMNKINGKEENDSIKNDEVIKNNDEEIR